MGSLVNQPTVKTQSHRRKKFVYGKKIAMDITINNVNSYAMMKLLSGFDYLNKTYNDMLESNDIVGQHYVHEELQAIDDGIEQLSINIEERFGAPKYD